ncbi:hypothetical protein LGK95_21180 [Clostridium algoriphilum]|uniref:hypothetical protein n=1 Tax=Clostridium algoriphilum TaxID=198347 RepID=UPI001CF41DD8|nr:hypothetical protein [Clostridium algoriphilum]MCB2295969.1 hypothetical protein [Clostridium algoriphilum]
MGNIIYHKDLNICAEKIEELRTMLINEYKANSPISIKNFIKLVTDNPELPTWIKIQKCFKTSSFKKIFMDGTLGITINKSNKYGTKQIENKKSDILKQIAEIYANNNNIITEHLLKENKLYPTYIKCYFTSISEAYKLAGVKATYIKPHHITKGEFIIRFTKLMPEFSKNNVTYSIEKLRNRGLTYYYIKMYYGDLYNLLKSFNISI